jgi:hypothetical protein
MLQRAYYSLIGATLVFGTSFALLWWNLATAPPSTHEASSNPLTNIYTANGTKLLGISENGMRKLAKFTFTSTRARPCEGQGKKGLVQTLSNIEGSVITRIDTEAGTQQTTFLSAPTGTYYPSLGELHLEQSRFALIDSPLSSDPTLRMRRSPALNGTSREAVISLRNGAQIEMGRVRAVIYDIPKKN